MQLNSITGQSVVRAARVTLRPLQKSDIGLLELYAGDERVAMGTRSIPHPLPPGAVEAFVTRSQADDRREDVWAMDGTAGGLGELVGVISLARMEDAPSKSEIGYWVAPLMWNTGLASEAVRALLDTNPQDCETIFAEVFQDNAISARVLTNAGFEYLGDAETYSVARGANVPTWTYLRRLR
ncbi:RimJ/RimL family protein N-acetyltransferase [Aliiruegeria haliotis]|uniref:RimJ/RimL family protein N-acetyltransferase n=1 Tax=Aliiruegeria haliotis TaxID=1280846 RepID=A0A2T0RL12_9RHOB|nr:GNAT family protein [Aliiruegeria haliotis]PRY21886.1 RimJ/RimL family protein N-acetyltransferase [Aliiruegeria haliotis]